MLFLDEIAIPLRNRLYPTYGKIIIKKHYAPPNMSLLKI